MMKKIILFSASIEEVPTSARILTINDEEIQIDNVCKTLDEYHNAIDSDRKYVFTYVAGDMPTHFAGITGIIHQLKDHEIETVGDIEGLCHWIKRWNIYWDSVAKDDPKNGFEAAMKSIYLNNKTQRLVDSVDEEEITSILHETREERKNEVRTELDIITKIAEGNEAGMIEGIVLYDKETGDSEELPFEQITKFISNNLGKIVVNGTESIFNGEVSFNDSMELEYRIRFKDMIIHRNNCEFEIEDIEKESDGVSLDMVKE